MDEGNILQVPKKTKIALVAQFVTGLILLVNGILAAVFYNAGSGKGSPYFIGGIITGVLMMLLSALIYLNCCRATQQKGCTLRCCIGLEIGVFATSLISTIVVCVVGLNIQYCNVYLHGRVCVRDNVTLNRVTSIVMFIFLMGSFVANGFCSALLLIYYRSISRNTQTDGQRDDINATTQPDVSGSYGVTTLSYPNHIVGAQGYYGPGAEQPVLQQNSEATSQLEEQNRLLREQIALQQHMIQLQQQQQQQSHLGPVIGDSSLPPSYESVIGNPTQGQTLQEQNRHLQDLYQQQLHRLPEKGPMSQHETPSAPPLYQLPSEDST